MLKTYQFKTRCKCDSHSSKTATVILPVDLFRGYGVLTSPKLPFPIDLLRRPYNSVALALPCDTVIVILQHLYYSPLSFTVCESYLLLVRSGDTSDQIRW